MRLAGFFSYVLINIPKEKTTYKSTNHNVIVTNIANSRYSYTQNNSHGYLATQGNSHGCRRFYFMWKIVTFALPR